MDRTRKITSVTLWGAVANMLLCIFKMAAGIVGRSSAMIADAIHSLSDLFSDVVVLVMVRIAAKGRDVSHDYGHGKFETLATAIISLILLVVGGRLMAGAVGNIHTVVKGGQLPQPGKIAFWAAIASIAVKEFLYHWTAHTGREAGSDTIIANAWHHRSDALSSVGSAAGIGGAILFGGKWTVLDPIVGGIISIIIIVVAVRMMIPALNELTEASLPEETEKEISGILLSVNGISDAHALKTRKAGPDVIIDVHIVVDPEMTVAKAHDLTDIAETALKKKFGEGTQISIHVEPDINSK